METQTSRLLYSTVQYGWKHSNTCQSFQSYASALTLSPITNTHISPNLTLSSRPVSCCLYPACCTFTACCKRLSCSGSNASIQTGDIFTRPCSPALSCKGLTPATGLPGTDMPCPLPTKTNILSGLDAPLGIRAAICCSSPCYGMQSQTQ